MEVPEYSSVLLPDHVVLEQVAWRVSRHHLRLLVDPLVLNGGETSMGSLSLGHIAAGP